MSQIDSASDGRCIASGQLVTPYVIEPEITVICPECGADVPLLAGTEPDAPTYAIVTHRSARDLPRRQRDGTQLMLGF